MPHFFQLWKILVLSVLISLLQKKWKEKSMLQEASSAGLAVCPGLLINTAITRPYGNTQKRAICFSKKIRLWHTTARPAIRQ
ncbi:hypothetical protein DWY69_25460 [Eisenbergiella massiliensis]|uniref:Uncharacterized protein n=1 Tax=Eisenbergiella massiliensis TaxID=1720294 RepID=A0A3E3IF26_9FIRM|nr:hypothetical protein DXC51_22200 [Eisenbergiella massiliensis]RGE65667.1 hypothetical protein DWY69_25460 [Eisenbergiella massiliensis]